MNNDKKNIFIEKDLCLYFARDLYRTRRGMCLTQSEFAYRLVGLLK